MSAEDFEVFKELREKRRDRRRSRLEATDDRGWKKFTEFHWWRMIDGSKLEYWPSANKWLYQGKYYRGALPKWLGQKINESDQGDRK